MDTVQDLKKEQRELEMTKLDNIQTHYDSRLEYYSTLADVSQSLIDLQRATSSDFVGKDFDKNFDSLKSRYSKQINYLEAESKNLKGQFDSLVSEGVITKNSEEWYSWMSTIEGVNSEIAATKTELQGLATLKFDTISEFYQMKTGDKDSYRDLLQSNIDLDKLTGKKTSSSSYQDAISNILGEDGKLSLLDTQLSSLIEERNSLVESGSVEEYSEQWYEMNSAIRDVQIEINDAKTEVEEYHRAMFEASLVSFDNQIEALETINNKIQDTIDYYEASGKVVDRALYQQMINNNDKLLEQQKSRLDLLEQEKLRALELSKDSDGNYNYDSEYYQDILSQINDCESSILDAKKSQAEWNKAIFELDLSKIDSYLSKLSSVQSKLEAIMKLHETQGFDKESGDYLSLIANADKEIESYKQQLDLMNEEISSVEVGSDRYNELIQQISDTEIAIIEAKISQEEWNDALLDIRMEQLEKEREEYEKQNDQLDRKIKLEKALDAIAKARSQKNKLVYRAGVGFVYEADQQAIKDAEEALNDAYYDEVLNKFDDAIDALEDLKDQNNIYDYDGNKIIDGSTDVNEEADSLVEDALESLDWFKNLIPITSADDGISGQIAKLIESNGITAPILNTVPDAFVEDKGLSQVNTINNKTTIDVNIGDIVLHDVKNVDDLAHSIINELPTVVQQQMGK